MDLLGVRSLPFFARRNYYYEVQHLFFASVLVGLVEAEFGSVVISKSFQGGPTLIALAASTQAASHLTSLIWGMLSVGRRKVRLLMFFTGGTAVLSALAGFVPHRPDAVLWFIATIALGQILLAGTVTVRSAVWRCNYPEISRGRIAARLQGVRGGVTVVTALVAGVLCDGNPAAYRWLYPVAALFALTSMIFLPKLRIRGERRELTRSHGSIGRGELRADLAKPLHMTALLSPGNVLRQMAGVLRSDRRFARYCIAQSLVGIANFMTTAVAIEIITRDLGWDGDGSFWVSTALIVALPRLLLLGSLRRWGRLFDSLGVARFRVINTLGWAAGLCLATIATVVGVYRESLGPASIPAALGLFGLAAILRGISMGGGALAWNIGHLDFAQHHLAEVYMGIHVSLTGVRGLIAPQVGMFLWHTIGWPVWLIAVGCALGSTAVFASLDRRDEGAAGSNAIALIRP